MPAVTKDDPLATGQPAKGLTPKQLSVLPEPPEWFTPEARDAFDRFGGMLIRLRVLSESDVPLLEMLAVHWATHTTATAVASREPLVESYRGGTAKNPLFMVAREASDKVLAIFQQFGMSPRSRAAVGEIASSPSASLLETLLA